MCCCVLDQVLTGGLVPFYWLGPAGARAMRKLGGRRGLLGMSTLEAADADDERIVWRVAEAPTASLSALVELLASCLHTDPRCRPLIRDVCSELDKIASASNVTPESDCGENVGYC